MPSVIRKSSFDGAISSLPLRDSDQVGRASLSVDTVSTMLLSGEASVCCGRASCASAGVAAKSARGVRSEGREGRNIDISLPDRKSVGSGNSVSVSVDHGGRRILKKKKQ